MSEKKNAWSTTGLVTAEALLPARLQAHIAAHIAAGPAKILAKPEHDYGHVALSWQADGRGGRLATHELSETFRCALSISSMELHVIAPDDQSSLKLHQETLTTAKTWIQTQLAKFGASEPIPDPKEWPDHSVAQGASFDCSNQASFAELERYFNNAAIALQPISDGEPHATPVRTWPHHFDTATLVSLDPDLDPESARSINLGFSPGDGQFAEPYWYVVPYPDPKNTAPPELPDDAFWHLEGWTGAILKASSYACIDAPEEQHKVVAKFLGSAYDACKKLLEEDSPR